MPGCGVFGPKFTGAKAVDLGPPEGEGEPVRGREGGRRRCKSLTDAGFAVVAPDVLGTGENAFPKPFPVDKDFAATPTATTARSWRTASTTC